MGNICSKLVGCSVNKEEIYGNISIDSKLLDDYIEGKIPFTYKNFLAIIARYPEVFFLTNVCLGISDGSDPKFGGDIRQCGRGYSLHHYQAPYS